MSLNIAVAGAGIGGLAAAVLAAEAGHEVTLFERFATPAPVGSGLVVQPVGLAVLDHLGAGAEARALGQPLVRMLGHDARRRRAVLDVRYPEGAPGLAMHRAALFGVLWQRAEAAGIRTVTGAEACAAPLAPDRQRRFLHLRAADGPQAAKAHGPFDLVIDACGARSALSPLQARGLGYGALWATVPWPAGTATEMPADQLRQRYRGASQMAGVLPIGRMPGSAQPLAAVFWSLPVAAMPDWRAAPLARWRNEAVGLWPQIAPFLEGLSDHAQLTPAAYAHGALRRVWQPGLVHIGDAAHRASPQLGQGANMALLDALALGLALRGAAAAGAPLEAALADYAAMRRWHLRLYQAFSAVFTPMYQSGSRVLPPIRDHLLAPLSGWPVIRPLLSRLVAGRLIPPLAGVAGP